MLTTPARTTQLTSSFLLKDNQFHKHTSGQFVPINFSSSIRKFVSSGHLVNNATWLQNKCMPVAIRTQVLPWRLLPQQLDGYYHVLWRVWRRFRSVSENFLNVHLITLLRFWADGHHPTSSSPIGHHQPHVSRSSQTSPSPTMSTTIPYHIDVPWRV